MVKVFIDSVNTVFLDTDPDWLKPQQKFAQPGPGDVHIPTAMGPKKRKRRDQCMRCSAAPRFDVHWGDGPYRAWFCGQHYAEWSSESETHRVVQSLVVGGPVTERFGDEDYEEAETYAEVSGIRGRRAGSRIGNATNEYQGLLTAIYDRWTTKAQRAIVSASEKGRKVAIKEIDRQLLALEKELKAAGAKHIDEAVRLGLKKPTSGDRSAMALVKQRVGENDKFVDTSLIPRIREKIVSHLDEVEAKQYQFDPTAFLGLLQSMRAEPSAYAGAFWSAIFLGAGLAMSAVDTERKEAGQKPRRVRWILDPAAEHCKRSEFHHGCPDLAGIYNSYDDLPTVPAGDVSCLGSCRCHLAVETEAGWEGIA